MRKTTIVRLGVQVPSRRGKIKIVNQSSYPTAEIEKLVRFGIEGSTIHSTLVVVKHTNRSHRGGNHLYSGTAYYWVPPDFRKLATPSTRSVLVVRVGMPEQFPMQEAWYRYGRNGDPRRREWPLFKFENWQEAVIYLAAHEAKHIEDFQDGARQDELKCELFAAKRLAAWRGE